LGLEITENKAKPSAKCRALCEQTLGKRRLALIIASSKPASVSLAFATEGNRITSEHDDGAEIEWDISSALLHEQF
jgi:hypothetical protein